MNKLQDLHGRQFEYLRLSITDVCNYRCDYCLPNGYQKCHNTKFLSLNDIEILVRAFAELGTRKIRITGGEPSLRRDLPDILKICKQTPGIEKVMMTSNGYRLPDNIQTWIDAGLDGLNISVDSLSPDTFALITGHDRLQDILSGISIARQAGFHSIKFNTVLMKHFTAHEFDTYLTWIKENPITVRFIELMETDDNRRFFAENHMSGEGIRQRLLQDGWQLVTQTALSGPAQEYSHADFQGNIGLILPYSKDFCRSCNRLRVTATGQLHLCLFAEQGIGLKEVLQTGNVDAVKQRLICAMQNKALSHNLHSSHTGATKHFAMLGG